MPYELVFTRLIVCLLSLANIFIVADRSYSNSIGQGCQNVVYSLLIHPYRLVTSIHQLITAHIKPCDKRSDWTKHLHHDHGEKLISMMKEMHIVLPTAGRLALYLFIINSTLLVWNRRFVMADRKHSKDHLEDHCLLQVLCFKISYLSYFPNELVYLKSRDFWSREHAQQR